jgi:hypothetical protein
MIDIKDIFPAEPITDKKIWDHLTEEDKQLWPKVLEYEDEARKANCNFMLLFITSSECDRKCKLCGKMTNTTVDARKCLACLLKHGHSHDYRRRIIPPSSD